MSFLHVESIFSSFENFYNFHKNILNKKWRNENFKQNKKIFFKFYSLNHINKIVEYSNNRAFTKEENKMINRFYRLNKKLKIVEELKIKPSIEMYNQIKKDKIKKERESRIYVIKNKISVIGKEIENNITFIKFKSYERSLSLVYRNDNYLSFLKEYNKIRKIPNDYYSIQWNNNLSNEIHMCFNYIQLFVKICDKTYILYNQNKSKMIEDKIPKLNFYLERIENKTKNIDNIIKKSNKPKILSKKINNYFEKTIGVSHSLLSSCTISNHRDETKNDLKSFYKSNKVVKLFKDFKTNRLNLFQMATKTLNDENNLECVNLAIKFKKKIKKEEKT